MNEMTSTQLYDRAADLLFRTFETGGPARHEALKREGERFRRLGALREVHESRARLI